MLEHQIAVVDDRVTVSLVGDIYVEDASVLREELLERIQSGAKYFEFDMTKVGYIDSSGLGVLVAVQKQTVKMGGRVTLRGLNGLVSELFQLTRLNKVFEIVP